MTTETMLAIARELERYAIMAPVYEARNERALQAFAADMKRTAAHYREVAESGR